MPMTLLQAAAMFAERDIRGMPVASFSETISPRGEFVFC
jgi:hypothetical protein